MNVSEAIRNRFSVRKFKSAPVDESLLLQVLDAGRMAPSAKNMQTWKFVLVTQPENLAKMSEICRGQEFVGTAPAVIVICSDEHRVMSGGQPVDAVNPAIALSFMFLQATELGLGMCWIGGFNAEKAQSLLDLPTDWTVSAIAPIGYADEPITLRNRKPMDEILVRR
ncbi:MAG TPA: nitroreductase family protein [Bellilinea sp.]|nr:nitroreductase family protein [Bellilinea sp.]